MATCLKLDVFVSPYKPLANALPTWNDRAPATWPATSASLISGREEAVLVDALLTRAEAERLASWVRASGKTLTTICITHGHADHFFGLATSATSLRQSHALCVLTGALFSKRCASAAPSQLMTRKPSKL